MPLLVELQRRRVFRALVGFGLGAFAVLQIVEPIMHGLHWPDAVLSYVDRRSRHRLPLTVALAWIFDVRGDGNPSPVRATSLGRGRMALILFPAGGHAPGLGRVPRGFCAGAQAEPQRRRGAP